MSLALAVSSGHVSDVESSLLCDLKMADMSAAKPEPGKVGGVSVYCEQTWRWNFSPFSDKWALLIHFSCAEEWAHVAIALAYKTSWDLYRKYGGGRSLCWLTSSDHVVFYSHGKTVFFNSSMKSEIEGIAARNTINFPVVWIVLPDIGRDVPPVALPWTLLPC